MTRLLRKKVPYRFNRAGYYYFSRRVPADLLSHYSYPRIVQGLKTRSAQTAKSRALVAAAKLDEYWSHLRIADPDLIGRSLLTSGYGAFARNTQFDVSSATDQCISLPEALEAYVTQKGAGKPKSFEAAAQRACTYLVDASGAKTLAEYTRADTLSYRDYLIAKGLVGSSVSRVMTFKFVLCAGREFLRFLLLGVFIRRFSRLLRIESDKKLMGCIKAEA